MPLEPSVSALCSRDSAVAARARRAAAAARRCLAGLAAACVLALPAAAAADEAQLRAELRAMEQRQAAMQAQIDALLARLGQQGGASPAGAPAAVDARTTAGNTAPAAAASPAPARGAVAAAPVVTADGRVAEVERKQGVMLEEVRRLKEAIAIPETGQLKSQYGMGPAASKVYGATRGVSLGGYGEFNYKNEVSDRTGSGDQFDLLRLVLYTGYKFTDRIVFNSELEFEHANIGDGENGEVAVEFASLDFLLDPRLNLRGGLLLIPMGFVNEMHEPPFFHGNIRPEVERRMLPSTWNAGGLGIHGELLAGLTYRTYAVTGLDASGFGANGIRGGRQGGSLEKAEDFAWVGRLDYSPVQQLSLGGSAFVGRAGQDQSFGNATDGYTKADVLTQVYEVHGQLRVRGFEARALGTWTEIDNAALLSRDDTINPHVTDPAETDRPVASSQYGWYGELAYDVMPLLRKDSSHYLAPWVRYSRLDTQADVPAGFAPDRSMDWTVVEAGLSYKPIPQVVLKLDYRNLDSRGGKLADEVRVGAGFVF